MFELLLGLVILHALLWQFAEPRLQAWGEKLYNLLTGKPVNQTRSYDSEGIPIVIYRQQGRQYNPLFVAAQAKRDYIQRSNPARLKRFIVLTDWLLEHSAVSGDSLLFPYGFDLPKLGLRAPWFSSLAQGVALTCFAQRFDLQKDTLWKERCRMILNSFKEETGLALGTEGGGLWFPEYPSTSKSHVLNGMMGVLIELDTCFRLTGLEQAKTLFDKGFLSLIRELPRLDYHGFSLYSLDGTKASRNYQQMHIDQLRTLNNIQPHPVLQKYYSRWRMHDFIPVGIQLFYYSRPKRIIAFWGSLAVILVLWRFLARVVWQ